ncbi:hypothetical protein [Vibrio rhizosphaerae]|uniref:hypothetical protein n=1 Tax=Vibrio rhizosphaerae TaxID=398736 RepID=UPI00056EA4C5|nr:hypothetical protein [Vibrio rhizosphaerae]
MKIEKINWISEIAQEAEVFLTDGEYKCMAFCQPCNYDVGMSISTALHSFMTKNIMLSYSENCLLKQIDSERFPHKCTAIVKNVSSSLVSVGKFVIELDSIIPAGVNDGDIIDFECARIDLW